MEQIRLIEEKQVLTVWAEMNRQTEAVGKNINAAVEPILAAVRTEGDAEVGTNVDAISGATVTSKAIARSVNSAVGFVTGADTSSSATSWGG